MIEIMVRFGYKSNELMNFLGVEIINPTYNLFAESDMDEIPQDAIIVWGIIQFA